MCFTSFTAPRPYSSSHEVEQLANATSCMIVSQNELKQRRCQQQQSAKAGHSDPSRMAALRRKFLETAMTYIGVPYAKRYHTPDCEPPCMQTGSCDHTSPAPSFSCSSNLPLSSLPGLLWSCSSGAERYEGRVWLQHWAMESGLPGQF